MTKTQQNNLLESLQLQGFNESYAREDGSVKVRCDQCEALVINGMACHETYCPNIVREMDDCDDYADCE